MATGSVEIGASCATYHSGKFTSSGQLNPPLSFLFSLSLSLSWPLISASFLYVVDHIFSCGPRIQKKKGDTHSFGVYLINLRDFFWGGACLG